MRKLLFFIGCLFFSMNANKEWEQFLRANKLYEEDKIAEASEEYEGISNKGPVVWYNFGNCLYQQNKKERIGLTSKSS